MTVTIEARSTRRPLRTAVFLPALGLIVAAATQIDAAITTNAFRSASPAPTDSLNFPWYGGLAGEISTWWSFSALFVAIGFGAFARSSALRHSRLGRNGAWTAAVAVLLIAIADFLSAANADALTSDGTAKAIMGLFAAATIIMGVGLTTAGIVLLRSGAWSGISRFVPIANGVWPLVMSPLAPTPYLTTAIGVLAALQVALGAAMIAQEATR